MSFKKYIIILTSVSAVLMALFIVYVIDSLNKYEDYQIDNYMKNVIKNIDKNVNIIGVDDVKKGAFDKSDASVRKGLVYLAENDVLTYSLNYESKDENSPIYDVRNGHDALLQVTLNAKDSVTRLGMFTYKEWEVKEIKMLKKDGLFDYKISIPNVYTAEVNGKKLTINESTDSVHYSDLLDIAKKVKLTYQVDYVVKGLTDVPDVKVMDNNGQPVQCELKGTTLTKAVECEKIADEATAKTKIKNYPNVIDYARKWSLYMSNDLHGEGRGFGVIKEFLIEGSYLYHFAEQWAASVNATFMSNHSLDRNIFTNEKVCNFEIYSDREFSCDVYLDKKIHAHVTTIDKMGERMHFVYYDGNAGHEKPSWKLVYKSSLPVN